MTTVTYSCEGCGIPVTREIGDEGRGRFCSVRCGRAHQVMPTREERFWKKVQKGDGCWLWVGKKATGAFPYGLLMTGPRGASRQEYAHRVSWEIHNGPIPKGAQLMHSCDNPPCVNPAHLSIGTAADNMRDRDVKGRHGTAKLTAGDVRSILARGALGERQVSIARDFPIGPSRISEILAGKAWKHVK